MSFTKSEFSPSPGIDISTPRWRDLAELELLTQVQIREQASKYGDVAIWEIENALRKADKDIPGAVKWRERTKTVKEAKRECRLLIGFLGTTGAGKSSLVNALLNEEDLLVVDDEKACTAVCVEIIYNPNDEPEFRYRATVDRISQKDWRTELETLFQDIEDQSLDEDTEDGEPDLERDMRIRTAFQKLRCVYPHVKVLRDLKENTVSVLMRHPNVKNILGKSVEITCQDRKDFASKIKSYIDSSKSREDGGMLFAQWPLVKLVRLYIKAPILKNGIVLVDLPGSMDTNAARGAIAANYQKNLSVTCVVAQTERAVSDKPTQDILGRATQRTLQLDNKFSAENLCFIVTKTDSSLKVDRYIDQHPNIHEDLQHVYAKQEDLLDKLNQVEAFVKERKENQAKTKKCISNLQTELKKHHAILKKGIPDVQGAPKNQATRSEGTSRHNPTPEMKKWHNEHKAIQQRLRDARSLEGENGAKLFQASERSAELRNGLENCKSQMKAICIQNRNEVSKFEIRKDYNTTLQQMGNPSSGKRLRVFCVSSWAFTESQRGGALPGFLKVRDTGIPSLQDWLIETTLPTRNHNAMSYLEDIVSLEMSMTPWIVNISPKSMVSEELREQVDAIFKEKFATLVQSIQSINQQTVKRCKSMVESQLGTKMKMTETVAANESERIVQAWAQKPMHWATFRAVNKACGEWRTYKRVDIRWNDELAGNYLDRILPQWTETVHNQIPTLRIGYNVNISATITKFLNEVFVSLHLITADITDAVRQWKESSSRTLSNIKNYSDSIFKVHIQDAARRAHREVESKILGFWATTYDQCGREHGTGHFKRSQQAHVRFVRQSGKSMYEGSTAAINSVFEKLWDELPAEFEEGTNVSLKKVEEDFEEVLLNHVFETNRHKECRFSAILQLQQNIRGYFEDLKLKWAKDDDDESMADEESDGTDDEIMIDDLFQNDQEEIFEPEMWASGDEEDN